MNIERVLDECRRRGLGGHDVTEIRRVVGMCLSSGRAGRARPAQAEADGAVARVRALLLEDARSEQAAREFARGVNALRRALVAAGVADARTDVADPHGVVRIHARGRTVAVRGFDWAALAAAEGYLAQQAAVVLAAIERDG